MELIQHILKVEGADVPVTVEREGDGVVVSFDEKTNREQFTYGEMLGHSEAFKPSVWQAITELYPDIDISMVLTQITSERHAPPKLD